MKKVAVINQFGTIPGESGYSRTHYIAKYLSDAGFSVDFISGSFNHWNKKVKDNNLYQTITLPYRVVRLENPSYTKNVSLKRLYSHHVFAKKLDIYLKTKSDKYDIVINVMPPAEAGIVSLKYCRKNGIPFLIDLNDLWPEAMSMVIKSPLLRKILSYPMQKKANRVYRNIDGIIGTSDTYRDRPLLINKKHPYAVTVYVGTDIDNFDKGAEKYVNIPQKGENEFWITYAGTLGTSYDIHTLMKAGGILSDRGYKNFRFVLLGDGPLRPNFEKTAQEWKCNAVFLGYTEYEKMAAYLKISDILVNSFVKKAPQSIVNKIGDYLSAGKPMINTCSDLEFRKLVETKKIGENVCAEDEVALADLIEKMYKSPDLCRKYSVNARATAENFFDRKCAYQEIVKMVEHFINRKK